MKHPRQFSNQTIERVREYWDRQPCNLLHSPKLINTKEYFDEVEARKYFVEPHIPHFAQFDQWKGKNVLEIGCGIGTDTINFARQGARVTAVDLSKKSLEIAQKRAECYGLSEAIRFFQGNAEELNQFLPNETFDLIYSFGVIHHTPHPEKIIRKIRSFTHPGTVIKLMVYHRYSWKALSILANYGKGKFWRFHEIVAQHSEAQTGCPITYTFTRNQVRSLLEQFGFRAIEITVDHIFPYRISDYLEYRYRKVWYFRWIPSALFHWLKRHFGWHLCVTAKVN